MSQSLPTNIEENCLLPNCKNLKKFLFTFKIQNKETLFITYIFVIGKYQSILDKNDKVKASFSLEIADTISTHLNRDS